MDKNIFEFRDYKEYLTRRLGGAGRRTGARKALSEHLQCQTAYLSQVLNGHQNLSLEQAFQVNSFLNHSPDESEWFLLLVQWERAGTQELKNHFHQKLENQLSKHLQFANRLSETVQLKEQDKQTYYNHWLNLVIHMMVSIPSFQTRGAILQALAVDPKQVDLALEFLQRCGLVQFDGARFTMGKTQIHLANDDENILRHHMNWRLRAMESVEKRDDNDLHYSVCFTIAEKDIPKIKDRIIQTVKDNLKDIEPSKEEVLMCNVIDLFRII